VECLRSTDSGGEAERTFGTAGDNLTSRVSARSSVDNVSAIWRQAVPVLIQSVQATSAAAFHNEHVRSDDLSLWSNVEIDFVPEGIGAFFS
jgi:hypothetical protein